MEIDFTQSENLWQKVIAMHKDNPLFDEVLFEIETERYKPDVETEEYYRRLDVKDELK
ncbi:hypothetical protein DSM106972_069480 [Dulcicalothrix desertica PCC 7102]|uniref:Uncharacterized protein n=1 Tax=Dulcicalothrix desertica PCC 7102 TaxID=232991 RepID=A0A3S1CDZ1_9CYAN|nr:hypothetical protein [Dulcicalothrix desertica]RUT00942.1 hypothetical protein DSM106972_069480 [Dulcicalothrix desertica PCC 7102]